MTGGSDEVLDDSFGDDDFNQEVSHNPYFTGMRVRHAAFGNGIICRVEGQEDSTKVTIKFKSGAIKKFLANQTQLERV